MDEIKITNELIIKGALEHLFISYSEQAEYAGEEDDLEYANFCDGMAHEIDLLMSNKKTLANITESALFLAGIFAKDEYEAENELYWEAKMQILENNSEI